MIVYADVVIGLNFLVDYLLILGTYRLTGKTNSTIRALIGSVLGAVYSGLCLIPQFYCISGEVCRALVLALICIVSFGIDCCTFRRSVIFLILSMSLGGLALGIGNGSFWSVLCCCFGLYLVVCSGILDVSAKKYIKAELYYRGVSRVITALLDTGNMLRDPISGEAVLIVGPEIAQEMLGITQEQLNDPIKAISELQIIGMRILPYSSVGKQRGMLLALRMDKVKLNGVDSGKLVAFSPDAIGGSSFQALAGGTI